MKIRIPNSKTRIFGIIGHPLDYTLSPLLHNFLFKAHDLNALYLPFDVKAPSKDEILTLNKYGLDGLSVTIPHKEWAFSIADRMDESSSLMRAGNTLIIQEDGIHLYNTDGIGAKLSIQNFNKTLLEPQLPGDILIIGSGGSTRGIGFSILQDWKIENMPLKKNIVISARNHEKGIQLVREMNEYLPNSTLFINLEDMQKTSPSYVKLVIHATQVGMSGQEPGPLLTQNSLHEDMVLFDIVYKPMKTQLVQMTKKFNIPIIPGLDMLLYQGLEQFKLFTQITPNSGFVKKVRKLLFEYLKKNSKS